MIEILKSKIHRATITDAKIEYEGSITLSEDLLKAANLYEYQKVLIADINNGARFETYIIKTEVAKTICINGAAAKLVNVGDKIIIMAFEFIEETLAETYIPRIVLLDENNEIK